MSFLFCIKMPKGYPYIFIYFQYNVILLDTFKEKSYNRTKTQTGIPKYLKLQVDYVYTSKDLKPLP